MSKEEIKIEINPKSINEYLDWGKKHMKSTRKIRTLNYIDNLKKICNPSQKQDLTELKNAIKSKIKTRPYDSLKQCKVSGKNEYLNNEECVNKYISKDSSNCGKIGKYNEMERKRTYVHPVYNKENQLKNVNDNLVRGKVKKGTLCNAQKWGKVIKNLKYGNKPRKQATENERQAEELIKGTQEHVIHNTTERELMLANEARRITQEYFDQNDIFGMKRPLENFMRPVNSGLFSVEENEVLKKMAHEIVNQAQRGYECEEIRFEESSPNVFNEDEYYYINKNEDLFNDLFK